MDKNINRERVEYIKSKGKFNVNCPLNVLNDEQRKLVEIYGYLFEALTSGALEPIDATEKEFIEAIRQNRPKTECQKAWHRYLERKGLENKYTALNKQPELEQDQFHNREGAKDIQNTLHNVWKDNSKNI